MNLDRGEKIKFKVIIPGRIASRGTPIGLDAPQGTVESATQNMILPLICRMRGKFAVLVMTPNEFGLLRSLLGVPKTG
jgi:hypothetical protein